MANKIAYVFPGQGSQHPGMGLYLYQNSGAAKQLFHELEEQLPGLMELCFHGDESKLKQTQNTQPAIFAVSMAGVAVLEEKGIKAQALAGFSLGEVSALTCGGVFDLKTGFDLVQKRGDVMGAAAAEIPASMVAVLKLSANQVEDLAKGFEDVYPVNYNGPGQTVVAGSGEGFVKFQTAVKEQKGRVIPLQVGGGFHSPFMKEASTSFANALEDQSINDSILPIYSNLTANPYGQSEQEIKDTLAKQMISPVLWQKTMENMIATGVDTFIEVGPGKTLKGLIEKINKEVAVRSLEDFLTP